MVDDRADALQELSERQRLYRQNLRGFQTDVASEGTRPCRCARRPLTLATTTLRQRGRRRNCPWARERARGPSICHDRRDSRGWPS